MTKRQLATYICSLDIEDDEKIDFLKLLCREDVSVDDVVMCLLAFLQ